MRGPSKALVIAQLLAFGAVACVTGDDPLDEEHASFPSGKADGAVEAGGKTIGYTESALVADDGDVPVTATEDAIIVAFTINPDAPVTRQGTIGR